MPKIILRLCGTALCLGIAGCGTPVSTSSAPPPIESAMPSKPEKNIPEETAGEPNQRLIELGRIVLNDYTPMPVYSKGGSLGIVKLTKGTTAKLDGAIVILEDKEITNRLMELEDGYVFFNVGKSGPLKVAGFNLKTGDCVLFENGHFRKLDGINILESLRLQEEIDHRKTALAVNGLQQAVMLYAVDHDGKFPEGNAETVFQLLLRGCQKTDFKISKLRHEFCARPRQTPCPFHKENCHGGRLYAGEIL